jgi:hypothetical protein
MSSPPNSAGSGTTGPLDGWSDAAFHKPAKDQVVMGWTGRFMCKCKYDEDRKVWTTVKGTPIKVLFWEWKAQK